MSAPCATQEHLHCEIQFHNAAIIILSLKATNSLLNQSLEVGRPDIQVDIV
jgi:hypothetical protein